MTIDLKEVQTKSDMRKFIDFPVKLYRNNPYYVPAMKNDELKTLSSTSNPAFEFCKARYWLAYKDNKIAGRVAAIVNQHHIDKWKQPYMRFGWLDFVDDYEVSKALIKAVEDWARELGLDAVHGPLGFTNLDREGMLVEGFNELATLATSYNYPYYPKHVEQLGYRKDIDYVEFEITIPSEANQKVSRIAEIALKRNNLTLFVPKTKQDLLPFARECLALMNDEYSHIYGTISLTEKQIDAYVDQYFGLIDPEFTSVVVNQENKLVAFGITMPSLSKAMQKCGGKLFPFGWYYILRDLRKNDRADLLLVAVSRAYQGLGVNAVLMDQISKFFIQRGIRLAESNPEMETNLNVQSQWQFFDSRQHKRRRCYIKFLH